MLIYNPDEAESAIHYTIQAAGTIIQAMGKELSYNASFVTKCGLGTIILDAGQQRQEGKLIPFPVGIYKCEGKEYLYFATSNPFYGGFEAEDGVTTVVKAVLKPAERYATDLYDQSTMADLNPKDLSTGEEGLRQIIYMSHLAKVKLLRELSPTGFSEAFPEDEAAAKRRACIEHTIATVENPFAFKPV